MMASSVAVWRRPSAHVYETLNPGCLHVWRVQLKQAASEVWRTSVLSEEERARARRFRRAADRDRFEVGRVMLRCLIGRYLRRPPESVRFTCNAHGKPVLDDSRAALRFNVSHSHQRILCAVAIGADVGVDVEFVRDDVDWAGIAATSFRPEDRRYLDSLPHDQAINAFFELWVQCEALLKAEGMGLAGSLESSAIRDRWSVRPIDMGHDYRAALAVGPAIAGVTCLEWLADAAQGER